MERTLNLIIFQMESATDFEQEVEMAEKSEWGKGIGDRDLFGWNAIHGVYLVPEDSGRNCIYVTS
ncbi:hypothetical protein OUZ56_028243 [Daphnia magna]|uniref:Uncharacterized protein n=1 Tax=Daphnia magna TaxID=35525 RepID=A0ABR0B3A4_9CRUS|nr:hypothetical protein OUZ56_028243 [Daphnia magna]